MNFKMSPSRIGRSTLAALFTIAGIATAWNVWQAEAEDTPKPDASLKAFMRKKLDASSQILEGLTTEDSDLIQQGAKGLIELSKAEKWQILADADYRAFSIEFRNTAKKLAEAAEKGNFDNAALQWFDATKSCIECHKYVRQVRATKK